VGRHTGARRVERELPDRDAHAVRTEITEAEDTLAIGHHDHADIVRRPVGEHLADTAAIFGRNVQPATAPEDAPELLARLPHRRGVEHRHQLFQMIDDEAVEQRHVAIMQRDEIRVLLDRSRLGAHTGQNARQLLIL